MDRRLPLPQMRSTSSVALRFHNRLRGGRPEYGRHGVFGHPGRRAHRARLGRPGWWRHHPFRVPGGMGTDRRDREPPGDPPGSQRHSRRPRLGHRPGGRNQPHRHGDQQRELRHGRLPPGQRGTLRLPAACRERQRGRAMDRVDPVCRAAGRRGAGGPERDSGSDQRRRRPRPRTWGCPTRADDLGRPAGSQHHRVSEKGRQGVGGHSRLRRDHHRRKRENRQSPSGQRQRRRAGGARHNRRLAGAGPAHGLAGRTRKRPGDADLGRPGKGRLHRVLSLHRGRRGDVDPDSRQRIDLARPVHPLHRREPHQRAGLPARGESRGTGLAWARSSP